MSTIVTETAQYANTTLPDRGQDGEVIYMDAGVSPQWPLWSRLRWLRPSLHPLRPRPLRRLLSPLNPPAMPAWTWRWTSSASWV